jgi:hypothetical protein
MRQPAAKRVGEATGVSRDLCDIFRPEPGQCRAFYGPDNGDSSDSRPLSVKV